MSRSTDELVACGTEGNGISSILATNLNSSQLEGVMEIHMVKTRYKRLLVDIYGL